MNFKTKEVTLSDGSTVWDVNVFANGEEKFTLKPMCIFSCIDERSMISFVTELGRLIEKHTCENFKEG